MYLIIRIQYFQGVLKREKNGRRRHRKSGLEMWMAFMETEVYATVQQSKMVSFLLHRFLVCPR